MPGVPLARPDSAGELYLARGEDVPLARPIMPGDIFEGVDIGVEHCGLMMIVAHPCSMRQGAQLRSALAAAPIRAYQSIPLERWREGHYDVFPLPDLSDTSRGAILRELGTARSGELLRERRVACLSNRGIYMLQQRFAHSLTRVAVGLELFEQANGHVIAEAELEEEWVEALAPDLQPASIDAQVEAFTSFMDEGHRDALQAVERRSDVRRTVREAIRARARQAN